MKKNMLGILLCLIPSVSYGAEIYQPNKDYGNLDSVDSTFDINLGTPVKLYKKIAKSAPDNTPEGSSVLTNLVISSLDFRSQGATPDEIEGLRKELLVYPHFNKGNCGGAFWFPTPVPKVFSWVTKKTDSSTDAKELINYLSQITKKISAARNDRVSSASYVNHNCDGDATTPSLNSQMRYIGSDKDNDDIVYPIWPKYSSLVEKNGVYYHTGDVVQALGPVSWFAGLAKSIAVRPEIYNDTIPSSNKIYSELAIEALQEVVEPIEGWIKPQFLLSAQPVADQGLFSKNAKIKLLQKEQDKLAALTDAERLVKSPNNVTDLVGNLLVAPKGYIDSIAGYKNSLLSVEQQKLARDGFVPAYNRSLIFVEVTIQAKQALEQLLRNQVAVPDEIVASINSYVDISEALLRFLKINFYKEPAYDQFTNITPPNVYTFSYGHYKDHGKDAQNHTYEDRAHGDMDFHVLANVHESGMFDHILKDKDYKKLAKMVKYNLYQGFESTSSPKALFSNRQSGKKKPFSNSLPGGYIFLSYFDEHTPGITEVSDLWTITLLARLVDHRFVTSGPLAITEMDRKGNTLGKGPRISSPEPYVLIPTMYHFLWTKDYIYNRKYN